MSATIIQMPTPVMAARFSAIVTQTIYSEPTRKRKIIEQVTDQTMTGLIVLLRKHEAQVRDSLEAHFWWSPIHDTPEGRRRVEITVHCGGEPLTDNQVSMINETMTRMDLVPAVEGIERRKRIR